MSRTARRIFQWDDPLSLDGQISTEERAVRDTAHAHCQEQLQPQVFEPFRHETCNPMVFRSMGELGAARRNDPGAVWRRWPQLRLLRSYRARGRAGGFRLPVDDERAILVVMVPIHAFGNEANGQKYLPKLASGEWIGCRSHRGGNARNSRAHRRASEHGNSAFN